MSSEKWSKSDKAAARTLLDKAFEREFNETKTRFIKQAADWENSDDLYQMTKDIRETLKTWDSFYLHRFSDMDLNLMRHYLHGYLNDEDLMLLSEKWRERVLKMARDRREWAAMQEGNEEDDEE